MQALPKFDGIDGAFGRGVTGEEGEVFHLPHPELALGMRSQEWAKCGDGNVAQAGESDMGTKGTQVRLKTGVEYRVLKVLVQRAKVRSG